jgi:hypothetical protein
VNAISDQGSANRANTSINELVIGSSMTSALAIGRRQVHMKMEAANGRSRVELLDERMAAVLRGTTATSA